MYIASLQTSCHRNPELQQATGRNLKRGRAGSEGNPPVDGWRGKGGGGEARNRLG